MAQDKDISDNIEGLRLSDDSASADSCGYDSAKESMDDTPDNLLTNIQWLNKKKHVFIISESGKPVYSR